MFYRQAVGLLKRIRHSSQTVVSTTCRKTNYTAPNYVKSSIPSISRQHSSDFCLRNKNSQSTFPWILLCSQAAIFMGMNSTVSFAEEAEETTELIKIEEGSVVSNIHTSKWRVFTDNGRNLASQGKLEEAERFFLLALQEAKEGFGEKDAHVASACNNLAELYRVRKAFEKAEPFYLEAVEILEASYGPEDVRVGAALHNLGQFYLVQRKLEEAHKYYERALKIKGRVLGYGHSHYADTMYHLGTVMHLEGKDNDSVTLIQNSIKILEEGGQGESRTCLQRLRYLSQIHLKSDRLTEAENVQRKIMHVMELSKGWDSMETVISAERLALILQSIGSLKEAKELLLKCLNVRKAKLPKDDIQIGANILHLARVISDLSSNQMDKENISELDEAKSLLENSIRIMRQYLDAPSRKKRNLKYEHPALILLLQSYVALGQLEMTENHIPAAENAFCKCISAFNESAQSGIRSSICNSPNVKGEYLSCLKHLATLISEHLKGGTQYSKEAALVKVRDEIKRIEADLSQKKKN